jgi:hypothetical protein
MGLYGAGDTLNPAKGGNDRLYFAEFDAMTADLDLPVDSADVVKLSAAVANRPIAAAIVTSSQSVYTLHDETLPGKVVSSQISAGDSASGDPDLTRRTIGHRLPRRVPQ